MSETIPFNRPPVLGGEIKNVRAVAETGRLAGNGPFTRACERWIEERTGCTRALMTPSCTSALELAALLIGVSEGDEVILPSFTFPSTANAFALRGATPVFVDIDPVTMNIDPACVADAVTAHTRAIIPVHYAGVVCDMEAISRIAEEHSLWVVEDAAQALDCTRRGAPAGGFGHLAAFSFHESKNYVCGEGGMLVANDAELGARAEIMREKGTNRAQFFRGEVDKYNWREIGGNFMASELQAAWLAAQLDDIEIITEDRWTSWRGYLERLAHLVEAGTIELLEAPEDCRHTAHIFALKCRDLTERGALIAYLKARAIHPASHYLPLHSAPAGVRIGRFAGADRYTTAESERLLRLPMFFGLTAAQIERVCAAVEAFFSASA